MDDISIPKNEYDELRGRPSRDDFDALRTRVEAAEKKVEETEAAKAKVEEEKEAAETARKAAEDKVKGFEEQANRQSLRDERWEHLGNEFTAKLDGMPTTKANLLRDAEAMEDVAWDTRLKEVEETTGVKRDAKKDGTGGSGSETAGTFSREEIARAQVGGGGGTGGLATLKRDQTPGERRSVVAGLTKAPRKK